jgi:glycogen(starch) synthase
VRLLMSANSFYPSVGGYERVAITLAEGLVSRGHEVKVLTFSSGGPDDNLPYEIFRNPSVRTVLKLMKWCDIYLQNNVSFKLLWPVLIYWRPLAVIHHGFYRSSHESLASAWKQRLKHLVTLFSTNIAVSKAIAMTLPGRSHVVLNPYRDDLFMRDPKIEKTNDLFFVGRMVPDKGIDLLLDALDQLRGRGIQASLSLAGSGPEEAALKHKVRELGLEGLVNFVGRVSDEQLNALLNQHRIMIVPTREGEGFGVVALEGIACGCVVVGSSCGGLPEAIGDCGRIFENGNSASLASVLFELLTTKENWNRFLSQAKSHLDRHKPQVVLDRYLSILEPLARPNNTQITASRTAVL